MRRLAALLTLLLAGCGGASEAAVGMDAGGTDARAHDAAAAAHEASVEASTGMDAGPDVSAMVDADAGARLDAPSMPEVDSPPPDAGCANGCLIPDGGGCALGGFGDMWCGPTGGTCSPCPAPFACTKYYPPDGGIVGGICEPLPP